MSIKIALKYLIKTADPLIDFGPSVDPKAAPKEAYDKFFSVHSARIVVTHLRSGVLSSIGPESIYTYENFQERISTDLKMDSLTEQDKKNMDVLKQDCLNLIFKDQCNAGKSPHYLMHDFFHCFFEENSVELKRIQTSMDDIFSPEKYVDAFKKDYDLSLLKNYVTSENNWLHYFKHNSTVGSVYHILASMIPEDYWHLGAGLSGLKTGNWFSSAKPTTELATYEDALADMMPMFFNPAQVVDFKLELKPLAVMEREHSIHLTRDLAFSYPIISPKPESHNISLLFQESIRKIMGIMNQILNNNVGKVMVIQ